MPQVTFHVLSDAAPDAHLRHACRLAESATDAGQRVFIRVQDDAQAKRIDDLLWTFGDRSFVPHEIVMQATHTPSHERVRVLIGMTTPTVVDLAINLANDALTPSESLEHIAEFVPADEERKRAARARFKAYRDAGVEPVTQPVE